MKEYLVHLKNRFLKGLFIILPISLTLWILYRIFMFLDNLIGPLIYNLIGTRIHGLGVIVVIELVIIIGVFGSNYIGKALTQGLEKLFESVPVVKSIYKPIKDVIKTVSHKNLNEFKKVVLVTYPKENSYSIGFVTKENIKFGDAVRSSIFIPTSPNPTSGILLFLNREDYQELDISVEDAIKMVISLGAVSPDVLQDVKFSA